MNHKSLIRKMHQVRQSVRLPKLFVDKPVPQNILNCFDSFIFNDNFTRSKIAIGDLQKKYDTNPVRATKKIVKNRRNGENLNIGFDSERYSQVIGEGRIIYRKFQLDSVRDRDSKYTLEFPPVQSQQQQGSHCNESDIMEYNRVQKAIQQLNKSIFRDYLQENKLPTSSIKKWALLNRQQRRITKQQQDKIMRVSKFISMEQNNEEVNIEQQYWRDQQSKYNKQNQSSYIFDEKKQMKQNKEDQDMQDIHKDFINKMNFYVKRTIQESGEYLIEPTTEQLHKIHLTKPLGKNQKTLQIPSFQHVSKTLSSAEVIGRTGRDPHLRALEISRIVNMQDTRTHAQKNFFKAVERIDIFDVSTMLSKDPQLIGIMDPRGNNSLHVAAKLGDAQLFATLLQQGGKDYLLSKNYVHTINIIDWTDTIKFVPPLWQ